MKPRLIIYLDHYLPGLGSGGPISSITNLVSALRGTYDIEIVTRGSEFRTGTRYSVEAMSVVRSRVGVSITYLPVGWRLLPALIRHFLLNVGDNSIVYLNSFFSRPFSLVPVVVRWILRRNRVPCVLAPRGEFGTAALAIRPLRKRAMIFLARHVRLYRGVLFHASSESEKSDITSALPAARVQVAHVIAAIDSPSASEASPPRERDALVLAVIARLSPIKGQSFLCNMIPGVPGRIHIIFAGELDDPVYWQECAKLLANLPKRISWEYRGVVDAVERTRILESAHLFVLPTQGESYGHAIGEALAAGCPAIISDQTPWRGLTQAGAGADLSLEAPPSWVEAIRQVRTMSDSAYAEMRRRARQFRQDVFPAEKSIAEHHALFTNAKHRDAYLDGAASDPHD
jgi:glycosyltransferase involved in cell wall biosynthesis